MSVTPCFTRHSQTICAPVRFIGAPVAGPKGPALRTLSRDRLQASGSRLLAGTRVSRLLTLASRLSPIDYVKAPSEADDTRRAYFAITPVVHPGTGAFYLLMRLAHTPPLHFATSLRAVQCTTSYYP